MLPCNKNCRATRCILPPADSAVTYPRGAMSASSPGPTAMTAGLAYARIALPMSAFPHATSTRRAHRTTPRIAPLCTALLLALCASAHAASGEAPPTGAPSTIDPANWPVPGWPLREDAALERRVEALLATMTVEEKVGQIVQADITTITPDDLRKYRLGSILAGGNSDPGNQYNAKPQAWLDLADAFWAASMDTRGGGKAIPVIFGIDAVHGQSNIVGATLFPHNVGLGATRNPALMRRIGEITAIETRVTGMEWAFAPTVAVPRDDRWGRAYEGYSESPDVVASYAGAMVEGLQGKSGARDFLGERRVMVSVKHYLGDGGTRDGKDQGDTPGDEATLRDVHAAGYFTSIRAGAQAVMASFNSIDGQKMHGRRDLMTDVLKERMGFGGFIVGDWNGHGQIEGCTNTNCAKTFNAGLDMAMAPDSWRGLYDSTVAQAKSGEIPMARLDDAVRRILRVKFRMGLFEAPKPSQRALGGKFELLGAPDHRAVARQAVRESLVLLKNNRGLLPLSPKQRILVAGDGADDVGKQSGGWTLNWQGTGTTRADYPNADSIWEGFRQQIDAAGGSAELAIDGKYREKPDAAIVVFGENPYAEFQGDLPNLLYKPGDDRDLDLLRKLKADGIPVVAVFLSGRPLWMNREINAADAFVAAWLPGSEGAGIADVLLRDARGRMQHDFKGKLSFSWPRRADQYENNVGQANYDPLFAFGHGLRYSDDGTLATLPEDSGSAAAPSQPNQFFVKGKAAEGFRLRLAGATGDTYDVMHTRGATPDGALSIAAVDRLAQEDARQLRWSGNAASTAALMATPAQDLQRQTDGDVWVIADLRIDALPASGKVEWLAACGDNCGASVDVTSQLAALPRGEWLRVGMILKCLRSAGANDMRNVTVPFAWRAAPGLGITLSGIGLGTDPTHKLACPSAPTGAP
jgi:beta-glucosidase